MTVFVGYGSRLVGAFQRPWPLGLASQKLTQGRGSGYRARPWEVGEQGAFLGFVVGGWL